MRLSCPSCEAGYELPETMFLTGPRMVRCVRCAHSWLAGAPEPDPPAAAEAAAATPENDSAQHPEGAETAGNGRLASKLRRRGASTSEPPAPFPKLDMDLGPAPPPPAGMAVVAGWVATVLFLLAAGWGGLEYRADIIAAWPESARLYDALGIGAEG
jgi:predicted Zn finger-like uncharacterized protein